MVGPLFSGGVVSSTDLVNSGSYLRALSVFVLGITNSFWVFFSSFFAFTFAIAFFNSALWFSAGDFEEVFPEDTCFIWFTWLFLAGVAFLPDIVFSFLEVDFLVFTVGFLSAGFLAATFFVTTLAVFAPDVFF